MTKSEHGFIALLAVLIIGAASFAVAMGMLTIGTDNQRATLVQQQSVQARAAAHACAEEALQRLHDLTTFSGTNGLTIGQSTCSYTVVNGSGTATITTSGTLQNVVRKVRVYATIASQSISITSWQEIE